MIVQIHCKLLIKFLTIMKYQKNYFALVLLFAGLFMFGCKKDKDSDSLSKVDMDKISNLPYSELSPDEQKIKLEDESLAFLELCNAAKSSPAVDALQNLNSLLDEAGVDFFESTSEKSAIKVKSVKAAIEYSDFYGVFTWNTSKKDWDFSSSKSELKFVFPAKKGSTNNNAALSIKAASSNVLADDLIYMPKSVTCTLTVNNKEEAKIEFSADYKNNNPAPVKIEFKLSTGDGYTYWWKIEKGNESQVAMKMSFKNKTMFEVLFKSGIKFDEIFDLALSDKLDDQYYLLDKVNGYVRLMDDLTLLYTVDLAKYVPESDKIDADFEKKMALLHPGWADDINRYTVQQAWVTNENRYNLWSQYEKERSDKKAKAFNEYVTVALFSTKDKFKIADMIQNSKIDSDYWDDYKWDATAKMWSSGNVDTKKFDLYDNVLFLKFGDNTEVAASVYFSEGFDKIEKKLEDLLKAFEY